jgi:prepilin-type N-terminal cleavage/methylation domain-containing protein
MSLRNLKEGGHMKLKINRQRGFTIVELLIVIVVIGILAALVIVQFTNVQARARDAERKSDIRALESKVAEYYALQGNYPLTIAAINNPTNVVPTDACKAPGGSGDCTTPDYGYHAYKAGTTPAVATATDCDNGANPCTQYILYADTSVNTHSGMETVANPYTVTSN